MANIKLTLPAAPFSGQIVTFPAPCNCDEVTDGLIINGETYTVCDAMGECVTGKGGAWCAGAQISVVLDCENKKAFIQNGKATPAAIGAVNKAGDTMTGTLGVASNGSPVPMLIYNESNGTGFVGTMTSEGRYTYIQFNPHQTSPLASICLTTNVTGAWQSLPILHTGNSNKTSLVPTDTTPVENNHINWTYE